MLTILKKQYLVALIVMAVIITSLISYVVYNNYIIQERAKSDLVYVKNAMMRDVEDRLAIYAQVVQTSKTTIELEMLSEMDLIAFFDALVMQDEAIENIVYAKYDGISYQSSLTAHPIAQPQIHPWYTKTLGRDTLVASDPFSINHGPTSLIALSQVIVLENKPTAILGVILNTEHIFQLVLDALDVKAGYAFLIDREEQFIASSDLSVESYMMPEVLNRILESKEKEPDKDIYPSTLLNQKGVMAYQTIPSTGWALYMFVPASDYLDNANHFLWISGALILFLALLTTLLFILQRYFFITPILHLEQDIAAIDIKEKPHYRMPYSKNMPFKEIRKTLNDSLNQAELYFKHLQEVTDQAVKTSETLHHTKEVLKNLYKKSVDNEAKYRSLISEMSQGLSLCEAIYEGENMVDYRFIEVNPAFYEVLRLKDQNVIGQSAKTLFGKLNEERLKQYETVVKTGKGIHYEDNVDRLNKFVSVTAFRPQKDHFALIISDITDRKHMESQMSYFATHDQLTTLRNRRSYEVTLQQLDQEKYYPLTILMADVNGLKLFNDSFGHQLGDELLVRVAQILTKISRPQDQVFRTGGDEFILVLPNTEEDETYRIMNMIRKIASKHQLQGIDLSISFGYATKYQAKEPLKDIQKSAEDYMYRRKMLEGPSQRSKTINTILKTLYEKNPREEAHSVRVSDWCGRIGEALRMDNTQIKELKTVGLMHDIGKIGIDDAILEKSGKLDSHEWAMVKRHPEIGYRILSTINEFSDLADIVLSHHERFDGTGYPRGIKGEEIPLQARILAVADAFDAMISKRPYRDSLTHEAAIKELLDKKGSQFDPMVVDHFVSMLESHESPVKSSVSRERYHDGD